MHVPAPAVADAAPTPRPATEVEKPPEDDAERPPLELEQLRDAWQRSVLPAVHARSIPVETLLQQARPAALDADTLTLEFASTADFHRRQVEEPKNLTIVREALYEVTGRKLAVATALGEADEESEEADEGTLSEDALISMFKDTFDAREVEDTH